MADAVDMRYESRRPPHLLLKRYDICRLPVVKVDLSPRQLLRVCIYIAIYIMLNIADVSSLLFSSRLKVPLCLSRACLGKQMLLLQYEHGPMNVFSRTARMSASIGAISAIGRGSAEKSNRGTI